MTINKTEQNNCVTLALGGRLDSSTAPELDAAVDEAIAAANSMVLDFADLVYTSSAGLRIILKAQKAMSKKGGLKLINVSDDIKEVFDITGFLDILTIE